MRDGLNTLIAMYAWVTLVFALVALGFADVWAFLWTCAITLGLAIVARIGYAVYDAGRRSADKEEK